MENLHKIIVYRCSSLLAVFFLLLISNYGQAQNPAPPNSGGQIKISGFVLDKKTKAPVPFAHIGLPKQGLGTTSGKDGYFELKIPEKYKSETITVSFMGYKTYRKKWRISSLHLSYIWKKQPWNLIRSLSRTKQLLRTLFAKRSKIFLKIIRCIPPPI